MQTRISWLVLAALPALLAILVAASTGASTVPSVVEQPDSAVVVVGDTAEVHISNAPDARVFCLNRSGESPKHGWTVPLVIVGPITVRRGRDEEQIKVELPKPWIVLWRRIAVVVLN